RRRDGHGRNERRAARATPELTARRTTARAPDDVADLKAPHRLGLLVSALDVGPKTPPLEVEALAIAVGAVRAAVREVRDVVECEPVDTHLATEAHRRGLRVRGEGRSEDQPPPDEQRQCSLHSRTSRCHPHSDGARCSGLRNYDECLLLGESTSRWLPVPA